MNMDYDIVEELPTAEDYNRLRQLVGWAGYNLAVIARALPWTLYCVCALMNGALQ